jgi:hypothetical protein
MGVQLAREYPYAALSSADSAERDAHAMGLLRAHPEARRRGWSEAPKGAAASMLWRIMLQWAIDDLAKTRGDQNNPGPIRRKRARRS